MKMICQWCGEYFETPNHMALYCSYECSSAGTKSGLPATSVSEPGFAVICQKCGRWSIDRLCESCKQITSRFYAKRIKIKRRNHRHRSDRERIPFMPIHASAYSESPLKYGNQVRALKATFPPRPWTLRAEYLIKSGQRSEP